MFFFTLKDHFSFHDWEAHPNGWKLLLFGGFWSVTLIGTNVRQSGVVSRLISCSESFRTLWGSYSDVWPSCRRHPGAADWPVNVSQLHCERAEAITLMCCASSSKPVWITTRFGRVEKVWGRCFSSAPQSGASSGALKGSTSPLLRWKHYFSCH